MGIEIRDFHPDDRDVLMDIFGRAGEGAPTASLWGHPESEAAIYLTPYMRSETAVLLVASVDGTLVGYLAGCVDTSRFPSESERIDGAIKQYRLWRHPGTIGFFARAARDVVGATIRRSPTAGDIDDLRWPSHLHINVLPEGRGSGVGEALMRDWQNRLIEAGSPGCHLQTVVENTRAVAFFERMGFSKHGPTPPVPGLRYRRRRVHQQTMTWSPTSDRESSAGSIGA